MRGRVKTVKISDDPAEDRPFFKSQHSVPQIQRKCKHYFVGSELPTLAELEPPEPEDMKPPLSAAQIPETVGKAYCHATLSNEVWLKRVTFVKKDRFPRFSPLPSRNPFP